MVLTHLNMRCSDAILKYLAMTCDIPEHWYPRQPEQRARVDEYTAWHHTNTRPKAAKVFILEVNTALPGKNTFPVNTLLTSGSAPSGAASYAVWSSGG